MAPGRDGLLKNALLENALLELCAAIHSTRDLETLEKRLLEIVSKTLYADRGAILLLAEDGEHFASVCGWDSHEEMNRPAEYSRTIIDRVLREKTPVVSNRDSDAAPGEDAITAAICVPLMVFERMRGALYLDSTDPKARFEPQQLEWLSAIGGVAALVMDNLRRIQWLEGENRRLRAEIAIDHEMVGAGPALREMERFIARVAPIDSTVLIQGESGTGKELVARAIHRNSQRAEKAFIAINCAAITDTLLESELFGYEKGAFTGATRQQKGKLEVADGGTLFLDEVGELAPLLQAKLLRVLQEREFERVGGTQPIRVNIRLIAATNRDLKTAIQTGTFRQDLYYRLKVVSLTTPPLRQRKEDIPLLAVHFARMHARKAQRQIEGVSDAAIAALIQYDWPGNVRELDNAIERAVVLGAGAWIAPEDLPEELAETGRTTGSFYHDAVRDMKKDLIVKAVKQAGGNYTEAARVLGVHPNYLHRLIRNLDIRAAVSKAFIN
jgi:transcriptional regulator with GAF, ATPase, and Fis domain